MSILLFFERKNSEWSHLILPNVNVKSWISFGIQTNLFLQNDIAVQQQDLSKNTIQAVVRKLKNHDLLKVADIGYSGTVLTRLYSPNVTQEDFLAAELSDQSLLNLITNFIETNKDIDTLNNLEKMIIERQGELKK